VVLIYDAMGRMVEQATGGTCSAPGNTYQEILYGIGGAKLALMNGQNLNKAFIALPGGATAIYNGSGLQYYRHADWLGSSRLASTAARTVYYDGAYGPFGENYNETGTTDRSFTGQNQDTIPGLYDFMFREYSPNQGRWISPDPAGRGAVSLTSPQTWNRYAYVDNMPCSATDPLGLDSCNFNVRVVNDANFQPSDVQTVEDRINQIFGSTSSEQGDSVGINFNFNGVADATLTLTNASSAANFLLSWFGTRNVPFGQDGGLLGQPKVYVNNFIPYNPIGGPFVAAGSYGAHELGHKLGGFGDIAYAGGTATNIMMFDNAPDAQEFFAMNSPEQSNLWRFTPQQVGTLFHNCKRHRPSGREGDTGGGGLGPGWDYTGSLWATFQAFGFSAWVGSIPAGGGHGEIVTHFIW
jgi:RHS repeat-associated protein